MRALFTNKIGIVAMLLPQSAVSIDKRENNPYRMPACTYRVFLRILDIPIIEIETSIITARIQFTVDNATILNNAVQQAQ